MNTTIILTWIFLGLIAYLLGSIPFGFLIAKLYGVDVRTVGSKNIGATNVFRTVGKFSGILTFILDMGKGFFAIMLASFADCRLSDWDLQARLEIFEKAPPILNATILHDATILHNTTTPTIPELYLIPLCVFAGVCVIIGHNWTCFLRFKGGKGVATSLGVILALIPQGAVFALLVWVAVLLLSRIVSLASITAAAALGAYVWYDYVSPDVLWPPIVITILALLAIAKHHANIRRLLNGTEPRVSFSRKPKPSAEP